jgi:FAD/FMN-containing dehydrogenase
MGGAGELRAVTSGGTETVLDGPAIDAFRDALGGDLLGPQDPGYDAARSVWNGSIDRHPALIARCAGVADVRQALRFARDRDLRFAVRAGGHSFPGLSVCDGGLVIDLAPLKGVRVDPRAGTVRAQAGVLLSELDRETQAFGLAVPAGIVSHTGLAGLTLGGGIGWLMRKHGLTVDQLLEMDVLTADGELLTASATEHPDLFFGLRGGGGNFGIVTEFALRAHPVGPQVLAGPIFWPIDQAPALLRFYRDWIAGAPDDLMTIVVLRKAPPLPAIPAPLHGRPVVVVAPCYAGSLEEGARVLRPLREQGTPLADLCAPRSFLAHQQSNDPSFPHGRWYYLRSGDVATLTDAVIDRCLDHASRLASPLSTLSIWQMGGAVARVGADETAFAGRAAGHAVNLTGVTETGDGFDAEREWVRSGWGALEPHFVSVYVNHLMDAGDGGEAGLRRAYGGSRYERLREVKRRYDPHNLFRLNQNILPAPA